MKYPYYFWPETTLPWAKCAGTNRKSTLVLSFESNAAGNVPFLKKILRSVDLDFDLDIHFIPAPENLETQLMADPQMIHYRNLVLFGVRPSQIGILDVDRAGCFVFSFERLICVSAPALEDIESNPEFKKRLWSVLKQVFPSSNVQ